MIKLICVGKKTIYDEKINDYIKRLRKPFDVSIITLPFSTLEYDAARNVESKAILEKINDKDFVILLDERGKDIDNDEFTDILTKKNNIVMVIGGPYGVNETLRKRANFILKFSKLVFPYEICRLIIVEQIYRSQTIANNQPYHHR